MPSVKRFFCQGTNRDGGLINELHSSEELVFDMFSVELGGVAP